MITVNENGDHPSITRLVQTMEIAAREDAHLQAVAQRLFPGDDSIGVEWLQGLLSTSVGVDRLESFSGKFCRMQDTVMDKLIPRFLIAAGERTGIVIDNLNRAERLGIVSDAQSWVDMRRLRNQLVHEYVGDLTEMVEALARARRLLPDLSDANRSVCRLAGETLGVHVNLPKIDVPR